VRLLFANTADCEWAKAYLWIDHQTKARALHDRHATQAREPAGSKPRLPVFSDQLDDTQQDALVAMVESLRVNDYAMKTEFSYCPWVQRFLLSCANRSPHDFSESGVSDYVGNIRVHVWTYTLSMNPMR